MQRFVLVVGCIGLLLLSGCGQSGDSDKSSQGHMLQKSQDQLESAEQAAKELADAAAKRAEELEKARQ